MARMPDLDPRHWRDWRNGEWMTEEQLDRWDRLERATESLMVEDMKKELLDTARSEWKGVPVDIETGIRIGWQALLATSSQVHGTCKKPVAGHFKMRAQYMYDQINCSLAKNGMKRYMASLARPERPRAGHQNNPKGKGRLRFDGSDDEDLPFVPMNDKGKGKQPQSPARQRRIFHKHPEMLTLSDDSDDSGDSGDSDDWGDDEYGAQDEMLRQMRIAGLVSWDTPRAGSSNAHKPEAAAVASSSAFSSKAPAPKLPNGTDEAESESIPMILAIIPDVEPQHVLSLLRSPLFNGKAELVVEELLSNPYPKLEDEAAKSKKRKRESDAETSGNKERDYLDIKGRQVPNQRYQSAAIAHLNDDYPQIKQNTIIQAFKGAGLMSYATTFMLLKKQLTQSEQERGWRLKQGNAARQSSKGKHELSHELENERNWLRKHIDRIEREQKDAAEEAARLEAEIASGAFFECGCCFGETAFSQIVTCTEGCQFCRECAQQNANTQVGMRKYVIPCMSVDGCQAIFPESGWPGFLPASTLAALDKIKQEKEVDLADLDGLEKCPFCPFAMILENPNERLFTCMRDTCGIVSCRQCKREDHLPKTCKEADVDHKINGLHKVEEAMTQALIRKCPNTRCGEPYIKEDGCNKMTCPSCRSVSCFICGQIVTGYEHFKNAGSNAAGGSMKGAECLLWDDSRTRTHQEVEAARKAAAAEVLRENEAVEEQDFEKLQDKAPPVDPRFAAPVHAAPRVPVPARYPNAVAGPAPRVGQAEVDAARLLLARDAEELVARRRERLRRELVAREERDKFHKAVRKAAQEMIPQLLADKAARLKAQQVKK